MSAYPNRFFTAFPLCLSQGRHNAYGTRANTPGIQAGYPALFLPLTSPFPPIFPKEALLTPMNNERNANELQRKKNSKEKRKKKTWEKRKNAYDYT